jgi:hypothetical protein
MQMLTAVLAAVVFVQSSALKSMDFQSAAAWETAEQDERSFLVKSWTSLNGELHSLLDAFQPLTKEAGFLQVVAAPVNHTEDKEFAKKMHSVMSSTKGLVGKAMLMPALNMLKGLYEEQKSRIQGFNVQEQKSKDRYNKQLKKHQDKLAHWKDELDHHKISQEFFNNSTRDEEHQFKYWTGVRERAHRQFHNQLKLTHGLMAKEKGMIDQYNKALAEPTPSKVGAKEYKQVQQQVAPEIVLLQARDLVAFCKSSLVSVSTALADSTSTDVMQ